MTLKALSGVITIRSRSDTITINLRNNEKIGSSYGDLGRRSTLGPRIPFDSTPVWIVSPMRISNINSRYAKSLEIWVRWISTYAAQISWKTKDVYVLSKIHYMFVGEATPSLAKTKKKTKSEKIPIIRKTVTKKKSTKRKTSTKKSTKRKTTTKKKPAIKRKTTTKRRAIKRKVKKHTR